MLSTEPVGAFQSDNLAQAPNPTSFFSFLSDLQRTYSYSSWRPFWYSLGEGDGGGRNPGLFPATRSVAVAFDPLPPGDRGLFSAARRMLFLIEERSVPAVFTALLIGDFPLLLMDALSSSGFSAGLSIICDISSC